MSRANFILFIHELNFSTSILVYAPSNNAGGCIPPNLESTIFFGCVFPARRAQMRWGGRLPLDGKVLITDSNTYGHIPANLHFKCLDCNITMVYCIQHNITYCVTILMCSIFFGREYNIHMSAPQWGAHFTFYTALTQPRLLSMSSSFLFLSSYISYHIIFRIFGELRSYLLGAESIAV